MRDVERQMFDAGVVPVIKLKYPKRDAAILARTLCNGGLPIAEVTFRAEGADEAIRIMRTSCPNMLVGAGTVLTNEQVDQAVHAGAEFIVTPGFDPEIVAYCQSREIPVYPGCTTATDYHAALKYHLKVLKFFPAEQSGGIKKIKALNAPFPMFKIMPTGGITLANLKEYLQEDVICACGGSYMVSSELIENQRWGEITELCRKTSEIVREVRNQKR